MLFLLWNFINTAFGQNELKPLQVGDQVPDLEFTNLINAEKKTIKLSDYKGKLVILDFWATWCAPCIKALPKLDSLQKEFSDQLVILPITGESKEKVNAMLQRMPEISNLSLFYIYNTSLQDHFPFRLLPLEVWIDENGKVLAITDDKEVNRENIRKHLNGQQFKLQEKRDIVRQNESKPLLLGRFEGYQFQTSQIMYSSLITTGVTGVSPVRQYVAKRIGDNLMFRSNNCYAQDLFTAALVNPSWPGLPDSYSNYYDNPEFYLMQRARLIWEASDKSLYIGTRDDAITKGRLPNEEIAFNYEMIIPASDTAYYKQYALEDLNRYFGAKYNLLGTREKRIVKCYALKIIGDTSLFASKGGKLSSSLRKNAKGFKITNCAIDQWLYVWIPFHLPSFFPYPVINETGYTDNIDLNLGEDIDPSDFYAVNNALKRFGLEFMLVERELDMIVIRDIKK